MDRSAERFCEGEFGCLGYSRKVSVLSLLYKIYDSAEYPLREYLHHFVLYLDRELNIYKRETYLCLYFLDGNEFVLGASMCILPILEQSLEKLTSTILVGTMAFRRWCKNVG